MHNTILSRPVNKTFPQIPFIEDTICNRNCSQLSTFAFENKPKFKDMLFQLQNERIELLLLFIGINLERT
jgi:hypothetical protein